MKKEIKQKNGISIFEYLKHDSRGEIKQLDEIDCFVFTMLSYTKFEYLINRKIKKIKIKDFAKLYREKIFNDLDTNKDRLVFLELLEINNRYKDIEIIYMENYFDFKLEVQYAALAIKLKKTIFVSYRGTDTTLLGWKEDLNLSFLDEIPGQVFAVKTLDYLMHKYWRYTFYVGGHSKGGLLATHAASKQKEKRQKRIAYVMDLDSPGFKEKMLNDVGYQRMIPKIHTFIPEHSVVGLLYRKKQKIKIVETTNSGIMEHYGFAWMVKGNGFSIIKELESGEELDDSIFNHILEKLKPEELEAFSSIVYSLLQEEDGKLYISELLSISKIKKIFKQYRLLESDEKKNLFKTTKTIVTSFIKDKFSRNKNNKIKTENQ